MATLMMIMWVQSGPIYFFHTWLFLYLVRVRGFSLTEGGFYGAIPYLAITLASPLGGLFSDFAVRKLGKPLGQRIAVWVGMFCSAILLWEGAHAGNKVTAILLLALAAGCNMFASVTFWAASIDLGREYSGSVAGTDEHLWESRRMALSHRHRLHGFKVGLDFGVDFGLARHSRQWALLAMGRYNKWHRRCATSDDGAVIKDERP